MDIECGCSLVCCRVADEEQPEAVDQGESAVKAPVLARPDDAILSRPNGVTLLVADGGPGCKGVGWG